MINEKTILELKNNPLFYLFLGSKELFHTNFWFWLSTIDPFRTVELFSTKKNDPNSTYTFHREVNHHFNKNKSKVDLEIRKNGAPYIIVENKIKDIVKSNQLERIKSSVNDKKVTFVLTTPHNEQFLNIGCWNLVTYQKIS